MENIRIAIRDSTDTHNIGFFDNNSGIKYKKADLHTYLAGNSAYLSLEYYSKDIDTVRAGCHLAFNYRNRDYWLTIMDVQKASFKVTLTAYSINLEINSETRNAYKAERAMSMLQYVREYDAERTFAIGVNEVADKMLKLEWMGQATVLARLYSVANSFGAELEFLAELNEDYSLKRHVLNIYKKGNMGKVMTGQPIRVGSNLKVINYAENIKSLHSAVRAYGKDGLSIIGYDKEVKDDSGNVLYYSSNGMVYAPQTRDRFPSVGKNSTDNWNVLDLGSKEYTTKEALYGYMLGELKKVCEPEVTYKVEGTVEGDVGDQKTLIDDVHYNPALYVQGRISEKVESLVTGLTTSMTFSNISRKYESVASDLLKRVEALAQEAAPYIISLATDGGTIFKNGKGISNVTASLKKGNKSIDGVAWKYMVGEDVVSETGTYAVDAEKFKGTMNLVVIASVDGAEVAREFLSFASTEDGVGIKNIKRYYTTTDQSEGVTGENANWSKNPTVMTKDQKFLWSYDEVEYTDGHTTETDPAVIGVRGDDGDSADQAIQDAMEAYRSQLSQLSNSMSVVQQDMIAQSNALKAQATSQDELSKRTVALEETTDGTKKTIQDLTKTVDEASGEIQIVTETVRTTQESLSGLATNLSELTTKTDGVILNQATFEETLKTRVAALSESQNTLDGRLTQTSSLLEQTTKSITASISSLENNTVKTAELNLDNNGFVTKVGKVIDGQTMATMIAQDESSVRIVAEKMKLTGDMIVGGTLDASKINVTNLNANKIEGLDATFLTAKLDTVITNLLQGKILHSKNYETIINMDTGNILFQNGIPSIQGILPGLPSQFLTFSKSATSSLPVSITSLGSTTSNILSPTENGFTGLRISTGKQNNELLAESSVILSGNTIGLYSKKIDGKTKGWILDNNINSFSNNPLSIQPLVAGVSTAEQETMKKNSRIYVGDIVLLGADGTNISLMTILRTFSRNFNHLTNIVGRGDVLKNFDYKIISSNYSGTNSN